MENIPIGYNDEGNSIYDKPIYETDDDTTPPSDFDEYDIYKDLQEIDKGHFVECEKCSRLIPREKAVLLDYGTGYLCPKCNEVRGI